MNHVKKNPTPSELRLIFGGNLKRLCRQSVSISQLCRDLGINRTQFNRYLKGDSFPRPDILHRICNHFGVDARILLEPLSELEANKVGLLQHPATAGFISPKSTKVSENIFPSGFYRFSRSSFNTQDVFVNGIVKVYRDGDATVIRGYELREAMIQQGLDPSGYNREFRGFVILQEDGISSLLARRNQFTGSFNYLARVSSFQNNFWEGYATRTIRASVTGHRVIRMVYERLPDNCSEILRAARQSGFCTSDELPAYHRTLLRVGEPFS